MGRGSAYSHEFFMLVDDDGWEEYEVDDLKEFVKDVFNLYPTNAYSGRDAVYIGIDENDEFYVGLDWSGGLPCIFVERYISDYYDEEVDGELPDITDRVIEGFNKLVASYGAGTFRYPTSAWTSESYIGKYR